MFEKMESKIKLDYKIKEEMREKLKIHCPYRELIKINKYGNKIYECNCIRRYDRGVSCFFRFYKTCNL